MLITCLLVSPILPFTCSSEIRKSFLPRKFHDIWYFSLCVFATLLPCLLLKLILLSIIIALTLQESELLYEVEVAGPPLCVALNGSDGGTLGVSAVFF